MKHKLQNKLHQSSMNIHSNMSSVTKYFTNYLLQSVNLSKGDNIARNH